MTSHFIFCAISILLVYLALYQESDDWNTIELVVEKAMKFHRKLDNSVNVYAQKLLDVSNPITSRNSLAYRDVLHTCVYTNDAGVQESRARVEVLRSLNSPSNTVVAHGPTPDWAAVQDQQGLPCGPSPRGTQLEDHDGELSIPRVAGQQEAERAAPGPYSAFVSFVSLSKDLHKVLTCPKGAARYGYIWYEPRSRYDYGYRVR
jgi:hypothetical protein